MKGLGIILEKLPEDAPDISEIQGDTQLKVAIDKAKYISLHRSIMTCYDGAMTAITRLGVGVGVLIIRDGKVLLGLRNPDKVKASSELQGQGTWTLPGGKVDLGERLIDAAKRELAEETGLTCKDLHMFCVQDDITDSAHYVTVGFKGEIGDADEAHALEPETILEWRWFNLDDLPRNLYAPSKKFIDKYHSGEFYSK